MMCMTCLEDTEERDATLPLRGELGVVGTCSGRGIVRLDDDAIHADDKVLQEFDKH